MPLRLKSLRLSWFRGAAHEFTLDTKSKSLAIYGPNGSGKSSLVDALEYVLTGGKIGHLAIEQSGKRLEHAVPNIRAPAGAPSVATVCLQDGTEASVTLASTGMPKSIGGANLKSWSPARSILRQETVSGFVNSGKADKYAAILPLLGFGPLETAAVNLRAISLEVEKLSQTERKKGEVDSICRKRDAAFPGMDAADIGAALKDLAAKYLPDAPALGTLDEAVAALCAEMQSRLEGLDAANAVNALLCQARDAGLSTCLAASGRLAGEVAQASWPLLSERLTVLQATHGYTSALHVEEAGEVECPACGRPVGSGELCDHVAHERERLAEALGTFTELEAAHKATARALRTMQVALRSLACRGLWASPGWSNVLAAVEAILAVEPEALERAPFHDMPGRLVAAVQALAPRIEAAAARAPASTQQLVRDRDSVNAARDWDASRELRREIQEADRVKGFLARAEAAIREEIRVRSASVIAEISASVASMWALLHPGEPIDEVGLYQHTDADRAIDLTLRFHGKILASPRLTLSEGHRNSLGLCVFLALATRQPDPSPIILDDVVTSFDREHRASVTELLTSHLSNCQVIVLTHEYDWFIDLNSRLPGSGWEFRQLQPFHDPAVGLQWNGSPAGFDPARALLGIDAAAAANRARGLLDQHLAVISERLRIAMPFVRGPRNELRLADDMLGRLAAAASTASRRRADGGNHLPCLQLTEAATQLRQLLRPFANPPSHGKVATAAEAGRIISYGEAFLSTLKCASCGHAVHRAEVQGKHLECQCGTLRWRL